VGLEATLSVVVRHSTDATEANASLNALAPLMISKDSFPVIADMIISLSEQENQNMLSPLALLLNHVSKDVDSEYGRLARISQVLPYVTDDVRARLQEILDRCKSCTPSNCKYADPLFTRASMGSVLRLFVVCLFFIIIIVVVVHSHLC
jgi:hypothetical protein